MKVLLLFLASLICVASGIRHHTLKEVIDMVVADTDKDADGIISAQELKDELIANWDNDENPLDYKVSKNDFLHQWTTRYGDNHHDASLFFDKLDTNRDGSLAESDLLFHMFSLDPNLDGQVTVAEFANFVHKMHPCGHGNLHC